MELASNFRNGIIKNEVFQKHFGKYLELKSKYENERTYPSYDVMTKDLDAIKKYRVFITYQDYDIDLINDFSSQTLHIVNALSLYDMVSSEFILNNPLSV